MTTQRPDLLMRSVGGFGVAWGAVLLAGVGRFRRVVQDRPPSRGEMFAVRVLGARHLAQGTAEAIAPRRGRRLWPFVDLTHAASMVALAAVDPDRRRPALVSAGVAALGAAAVGHARRLDDRSS